MVATSGIEHIDVIGRKVWPIGRNQIVAKISMVFSPV
jgi:hypothetical protein